MSLVSLPEGAAAGASIEDRAVAAALTCVGRYGIAKTTLDDVAREAGCSRATLYRYFPGKQQLLEAAITVEVGRLGDELLELATETAALEDAVVNMITHSAREIVGHDALQFVLTHEPELLLPHIAFRGGDAFLAHVARLVAPALIRFLPADRVERAGEWLARVVLAYLTPPGSRVSMTDETQVRELVRGFVLPALVPEPSQPIRG
jgi:AcrR family transcriptional regulator